MTSSKVGSGVTEAGDAPASAQARLAAASSGSVRILGIDPGSQRTGVGIIDVDGSGRLTHVFHAALTVVGEATFPLRLKRIFDELCEIIAAHQPGECGIERVFMARNPDS
ncbi:MAG: crossover junction endodeoxyribonuclease RuvC, partial [Rhodanobacter sp.]